MTTAPTTTTSVSDAMLRDALKDAEEELCALGDTLVNDGWDTATIAHTLHVVRIALYGTDGFGHGPGDFEAARQTLHALRTAEAEAAEKKAAASAASPAH